MKGKTQSNLCTNHSAGSRPLDKGGRGEGESSRLLDKRGGGGGLQENIFQPFGPQFGLKIRSGGGGRPNEGPFPGPATGSTINLRTLFSIELSYTYFP